MNYTPNTIDWQIGDLVIHDADHKSDDMIMRVVGRTRDGLIKTKYLGPDQSFLVHACRNKVWTNPKEVLHDPDRFGIPIPAWYRPPQPAPASASEASPTHPHTHTPTLSPTPPPGPVAAVYAKYKRIDGVFNMLAWDRKGGPLFEGYLLSQVTLDLWNAIKAQEAPPCHG